jgi:cell wall-associated NlpC family hydrolase
MTSRGDAQQAVVSAAPAINATVTALSPAASKKPFAAFSASLSAFRDSLVATARSQIGTRYKLGGDKPGRELDCSALVRYVMSAFDISLPRTARQQATVGEAVPKDLSKLKPGDLLTFGKGKKITHIGIYVGDGRMVHASTTGKRVLETAVTTRNPLIKQWKGVRRVVGTTRDSMLAMAAVDQK